MPGGGWCNFIGDICYCDPRIYKARCFYQHPRRLAEMSDQELYAAQVLQRINDVERGWY